MSGAGFFHTIQLFFQTQTGKTMVEKDKNGKGSQKSGSVEKANGHEVHAGGRRYSVERTKGEGTGSGGILKWLFGRPPRGDR